MGKGTKASRQQRYLHEQARTVLEALRGHAVERCVELGHDPGIWTAAKRKFGIQAEKMLCLKCGEMVVVQPYLEFSKEHPQVPAMTGNPLHWKCR